MKTITLIIALIISNIISAQNIPATYEFDKVVKYAHDSITRNMNVAGVIPAHGTVTIESYGEGVYPPAMLRIKQYNPNTREFEGYQVMLRKENSILKDNWFSIDSETLVVIEDSLISYYTDLDRVTSVYLSRYTYTTLESINKLKTK